MIRIRYFSKCDPPDASLDDDTRAVPCSERYAEIDNECGAITFMDLRPEDVKSLGEFSRGDEIFVESGDHTDAFDRETEAATRNTHVWWRATVIDGGGR
jgi:hypothetical protein